MLNTIGFLGCGNMGGAIARAVCKAADPQNVWLANRTAAKAEALAAELGCNTTINDEVAGRCDLIFLAVKPQMMEELLAPLRFTLAERPSRFVLCSMAAGLSIARIQEMAGGDYPVIRIMPNTPASVGAGMIQYCTSNVTAEEEAEFLKLMAPAGRLDAVPENLIDAASCVSGCGPAWVYQFIEALADGGVACGLPRAKAQEYAAQMVLGSAKLVLESRVQPRRQHHPGRAGAGRKGPAGRGDGRRHRLLQQDQRDGKGLIYAHRSQSRHLHTGSLHRTAEHPPHRRAGESAQRFEERRT